MVGCKQIFHIQSAGFCERHKAVCKSSADTSFVNQCSVGGLVVRRTLVIGYILCQPVINDSALLLIGHGILDISGFPVRNKLVHRALLLRCHPEAVGSCLVKCFFLQNPLSRYGIRLRIKDRTHRHTADPQILKAEFDPFVGLCLQRSSSGNGEAFIA